MIKYDKLDLLILVFVVTVSQLSDYLEHHLSFFGFLRIIMLFIPVWWAWMGTVSYTSRFSSGNNVTHNLLLLVQMGGVGALAVSIPEAFGNTSTGFALSYAFIRFITIFEYCISLSQISKNITTLGKSNGAKSNGIQFIKTPFWIYYFRTNLDSFCFYTYFRTSSFTLFLHG